MDPVKIGTFIAATRREKNLTQAQLASLIGVTDKAVSRWERGVGLPDINLLEPLSDALEISPLELIRGEHIQAETVRANEATETVKQVVLLSRRHWQKVTRFSTGVILEVLLILAILLLSVYSLGRGLTAALFPSLWIRFLGMALTALLTCDLFRQLRSQAEEPAQTGGRQTGQTNRLASLLLWKGFSPLPIHALLLTISLLLSLFYFRMTSTTIRAVESGSGTVLGMDPLRIGPFMLNVSSLFLLLAAAVLLICAFRTIHGKTDALSPAIHAVGTLALGAAYVNVLYNMENKAAIAHALAAPLLCLYLPALIAASLYF